MDFIWIYVWTLVMLGTGFGFEAVLSICTWRWPCELVDPVEGCLIPDGWVLMRILGQSQYVSQARSRFFIADGAAMRRTGWILFFIMLSLLYILCLMLAACLVNNRSMGYTLINTSAATFWIHRPIGGSANQYRQHKQSYDNRKMQRPFNSLSMSVRVIFARHIHYTQGQYSDPKTREYFYYIDHQGQVIIIIIIPIIAHLLTSDLVLDLDPLVTIIILIFI